jgi:hypothetical protein
MAKRKTAAGVARVSAAPTPAGAPALAPARPVEPDEAETAAVRNSSPHATGAGRTPKLKAHLSAAQQRAALKKKQAQKRRSSK